ncbi:MAG: T9SS type A sorting domain-containing protein, partial [Flavobacterium sp.]
MSSLSNITSITNGLTISQCNTLASLNGLQNITSINGNISISNNPLLVDLTGLNGLISLNNNSSGSLGNIFLNQNNSLTSLNGLQNLTTLTKENLMNTITGFAIFNCNNLTDISALGNINNAVVEYIVLSNNTSLNNCAIETVCNKLAVDTSWVTISGNATGCESIAVVETACDTLSLSDFELESNLKIYPNPFNSQITFDFGNSYENVTVLIHDITGKQLYKNSFSGNQLVVNNLGNLPSG